MEQTQVQSLWFTPSRAAQAKWGKAYGERENQDNPEQEGSLVAPVTSQAARLLAHTPPTVTPGCEQACTGSILCSVLPGAIRTASLHPSECFSRFPRSHPWRQLRSATRAERGRREE